MKQKVQEGKGGNGLHVQSKMIKKKGERVNLIRARPAVALCSAEAAVLMMMTGGTSAAPLSTQQQGATVPWLVVAASERALPSHWRPPPRLSLSLALDLALALALSLSLSPLPLSLVLSLMVS